MAVLAAAVSLVGGGWLVSLLPGPPPAAVLGFGPVDGVVAISRCFETTDVEGNSLGTDCTGWFTPHAASEPSRGIVLDSAAEEYRPGTEVEVRTAHGRAWELSATSVMHMIALTGIPMVPVLALTSWLISYARGAAGDPALYFLCVCFGLLAVGLLALLVGIIVAIGVAIF
ncbi:hypothetical protein [Streptomyces cyaneofuscatus]|uniref:hypothetical protein n=1 Tax=Streptomyces cyaneofuscatus TaxID=66883 RepID=UPI0036588235